MEFDLMAGGLTWEKSASLSSEILFGDAAHHRETLAKRVGL